MSDFWPEDVIRRVEEAGRKTALEAYANREKRMVQAEADRIADNLALLCGVPMLNATSQPRTIEAVCASLLDQPNPAGVLRLKGALLYAQQRMGAAA